MAKIRKIDRFFGVVEPMAYDALMRISYYLIEMGLTVSEVRHVFRGAYGFDVRRNQSGSNAHVNLYVWEEKPPSIVAYSNERGSWGMDLWNDDIDYGKIAVAKHVLSRLVVRAEDVAKEIAEVVPRESVLDWRPGDETPPNLGSAKSSERQIDKFLRLVEPSAIEAMDKISTGFGKRGYRTSRIRRQVTLPTVQWSFEASRNQADSTEVIFWLMSGFRPLIYLSGGENVRGVDLGDRPLYVFEIEEAIAVCREVIRRADEIVNLLVGRNPKGSVLDWRPPVE